MTLAVILAPLLALCVVARGIGFLPALGVVTAVAMLVDHLAPLQEFGAACVVVFSVLPVWFVSRYQDDGAQERTGPAVPFLALGLMVILQLTTGVPAATAEAAGQHTGAAYLPAGLCVALAGLVAVTCRQAMVWQWAGLLACVDGVMLSGVIENQMMVVGVTALAGGVVAVLGGLCVHRVMLRAAVAPAKGGEAGGPKARSAAFDLGEISPAGMETDVPHAAGPEPRGLRPDAVVGPRLRAEVEDPEEEGGTPPGRTKTPAQPKPTQTQPSQTKTEDDAETPAETRPEGPGAEQDDLPVDGDEEDVDLPVVEPPSGKAASASGTDAEADPAAPSPDAEPDHAAGTEPETSPEKLSPEEPSPEEASSEKSSAEGAPASRRTPEMIARDVWLKGYLSERGRDA